MRFRILGCVAVGLTLACGGVPVAGESCGTSTEGKCENTTSALLCMNSTWTLVPCRGAKGCAVQADGKQLLCDQSMANVGDKCSVSGGGACQTDGKAQLTCSGGTYTKASDCVTCNITTTNQVDCQQGCNAQNCAGCCFNGACQPGNTAAACGKGGGACGACQNNQVCRTDQTCGVDPASMWKVQPLSAVITSTNNGAAWDPDSSAPDPYIVMRCPPVATSADATTPFASNTLQPTWTTGGCVTTAANLLSAQWVFQVWDDDATTDDSITPVLGYTFTENDFVLGTGTLQGQGGLTSLQVQLQKQ